MATPHKYIKDWKKIFLDTTVLASLFRSEKKEKDESQDWFVRRLINYLTNTKSSDGKSRLLMLSTITLSELISNEPDPDKVSSVLRVLNSENVEIVDFDVETALECNARMGVKFSKGHLHPIATKMGFATQELMVAREWITRDYMILVSAFTNNADVVLTADKKTFYPASREFVSVYCVLTYPDLFDYGDQYFTRYHDDKVESFLGQTVENDKMAPVIKSDFSTRVESVKRNDSEKIRPSGLSGES
jgi:hypothetical protein